jgi:hypothetical protein
MKGPFLVQYGMGFFFYAPGALTIRKLGNSEAGVSGFSRVLYCATRKVDLETSS